jgi:hypothetical protein
MLLIYIYTNPVLVTTAWTVKSTDLTLTRVLFPHIGKGKTMGKKMKRWEISV